MLKKFLPLAGDMVGSFSLNWEGCNKNSALHAKTRHGFKIIKRRSNPLLRAVGNSDLKLKEEINSAERKELEEEINFVFYLMGEMPINKLSSQMLYSTS